MGVQMKYTLSWYTKEPVVYLKRRPWWSLFGRDTLEYRVMEQRHAILGVPEDEAALLMGTQFNYGPFRNLILRLMGKDVWMVQFETEAGRRNLNPSEYVDTGK